VDVSSSTGHERSRASGRSIRFTFFVRVAGPAGCLVVAWGLATGFTLAGGSATRGFSAQNHRELIELAVLAGAGLVIVVLAALGLVASFARRLSHDISDLADAAQYLADEQLPRLVQRSRSGSDQAAQPGDSQLPATKTTEVARAAAAIASLQHTAVAAAVGEAGLRNGLRGVFISLARRNQSLLQRQLRLIDALEQKASDPAALADLFALDHLTTRMRRQADSLTILSGAAAGRSWSEPVPVIDVIRGAMAEVEDYKRVSVLTRAQDAVAGPAVADLIHLLAELIENATLFSPSGTRVEVRAERVANGFAIEIDDRGLGIEPDQLSEINQQLATPPDVDLANADQLGLFVAGKLAARHRVRISLRPSPYGGITAIVLIPDGVVVPAAAQVSQRPDARLAIGGFGEPGELDLRSADVVTLVGRHSVPQPVAADHRRDVADSVSHVGQLAAAPHRSLPRRTRQASLSPHLRDSAPAPASSWASDPILPSSGLPTPEHARDLAASLQSGWQRGRRSDAADAQPATGGRAAGLPDGETLHSEEA
jgi:signal transduction histidine kinase